MSRLTILKKMEMVLFFSKSLVDSFLLFLYRKLWKTWMRVEYTRVEHRLLAVHHNPKIQPSPPSHLAISFNLLKNVKIFIIKRYPTGLSLCLRSKGPTRMGFEPTRAEHNGLAVHRLNHSSTSSEQEMY